MALDLTGVVTFVTSDTVIFSALAFISGMAGVMSYHRLCHLFIKREYHADDSVTEAIVLEYSRRLRDYDRVIAELRTRVDIMEIREDRPRPVISQPLQPQPHVAHMSEPVIVTQHATIEKEVNSTTDYIFKLLTERPRSSREVQLAIGRTREHTARLMKKLHDLGLVSRDVNTKPFRYNITDAGREMLKKRAEVASVVV